jgi:cytochrome o ubiquinol oxidase subunit IV
MSRSANIKTKADDFGLDKKTFGIYFTGFILCVVLTFIPFYTVIYKIAAREVLLAILVVTAIAQFFVQVLCFLRLNNRTEQGRTNVLSFIIAWVLVLVVIVGSIWIMNNLNYFMMH